jgi:hypothetical protein
MQPQAGQRQQQSENIEAVLGRFQTWAKARQKSDLGDGVRELSYEEALRTSRYRWQVGEAGKPETEPEPQAEDAVAKMVSKAAAKKSEATSGTVQTARRARKKGTAKRVTGAGTGAGPERSRTGSKEVRRRDAQFQDVLAAEVRALEPEVLPAAIEPAGANRQVSLSIRFAVSERALIKTRAAEAGVSVSAYLRQCALEVEQLRAQVRLTLAALEQNGLQAGLAAEQRELPGPVFLGKGFFGRGFFRHIKRRLFGSGAGRLALRA